MKKKREGYTRFVEGPEDAVPLDLTMNQTPMDPMAGAPDKPGVTGSFGTIFTTNPPDSLTPTSIDSARIVRACVETRRYEEEQRTPTREGADRIWDLYHGRYDFSDKEEWQSQRVSPKVFTTVERVTSTIIRIKERSREWFDVEALSEEAQIYYNTVKSLLKFFLDHDAVNFDAHLRMAVKSGLLSHMMYMLVAWETNGHIEVESGPKDGGGGGNSLGGDISFGEVASSLSFEVPTGDTGSPIMPGDKQPKLRVEVLNPDYVYLDSTGRNRYKIWEVKYTRGEAMREATERGWDVEALKMAMTQPNTTTDTENTIGGFHEARDARKQDKLPDYKPMSKVKITNYFGDLYDQATGEILVENGYFIVANDAFLIYGPVENPFWEGRDPIVAAPFTEVPFAAYGRSPLIQNIDMFESWVEFYNLLMDYFQTVLLSIREIDMDLVEDYDEDIDVLYPGKVLRTSKGGATNANAIQNIPFSDIPAGVFQFMPAIQSEISENVMLSDSIGGSNRPRRGRITAMEDNRRAVDAGSMIEFIFKAVEDNLLAPVIRLCFYRLLQFMPQNMWVDWITQHQKEIRPQDPEMRKQWGAVFEDMKSWTPTDRWNKLAGFFKFKVKIYSALGDKQAEIENATFFIQTISQIPGVAQMVNWPELLRHLARHFDWDPEKVLMPEVVPAPIQQSPDGEKKIIDGSQLQASGGEGTIDKGPSLGAPTSISTNTPFIPGNTDGNPGKR